MFWALIFNRTFAASISRSSSYELAGKDDPQKPSSSKLRSRLNLSLFPNLVRYQPAIYSIFCIALAFRCVSEKPEMFSNIKCFVLFSFILFYFSLVVNIKTLFGNTLRCDTKHLQYITPTSFFTQAVTSVEHARIINTQTSTVLERHVEMTRQLWQRCKSHLNQDNLLKQCVFCLNFIIATLPLHIIFV